MVNENLNCGINDAHHYVYAVANEHPLMVWVDCEMTGLDLATDALVEIAVLVTDSDLNLIGDGVDFVIKCDPTKLDGMNEIVKKMHTDSGLLPLIPSGISIQEAEEKILQYLTQSGVVEGKSPIAGNSVNFDRGFIERDMPNFAKMLHYRTIDVSSIKELARRWYPKVYFKSPAKTGNHRALGDIQDSIAELAHYRANLFAITPEN